MLGNFFKKVPSTVYETSSDGSIVKKVFDPKGNGVSENIIGGRIFSFFHFNSTPPERKHYNDNGREYSPDTASWNFTEIKSAVNPSASDFKAPEDYQGGVPVWDGYNGK